MGPMPKKNPPKITPGKSCEAILVTGTSAILALSGAYSCLCWMAIQHKQEYAPLNARMALVPVTNIASQLLPGVIFGGFFFGMGPILLNLGILIYLILTIFQLITLPVEFDASVRAKKQLVGLGIIEANEVKGVNETLDASRVSFTPLTSLASIMPRPTSCFFALTLASNSTGRVIS